MRAFIDHIKEQSKAYLTFNYAERRGIIVLVMLILIVEGVNAILPAIINRETFDIQEFEEDVRQFELALARPDTLVKATYKKKQTKRDQSPNYTYKKRAVPTKPPVIIEINTADSAQLVRLYGIGPVFAERILNYRGLLGGFFTPGQLLEVYGMDSIRYEQFIDHVTIDTSFLKKIMVNEAEFKTLLRHPYLDYETVKLIVNYIRDSGPISCRDTLRVVIGYDPMYEKVKYYISF